ncbi:hypothetical protein [Pseudomonas chlororaphis]|uniref:hypothetical protein n=1 Tax=Pseudomonas chlororaphis TaxID=587753 RepID=UPI000F6F3228|nr:hypothetical protein [Pseudomonas chlororaphis]AZD71382.1 hypothetical protein C4K16_1003 [Pseudomonas chlororaphis subsp. aurantiaca]QIT21078.1 hypothetical protein HCN09_04900 [Pseudomonas chlororaphis subsp. aurantiaca]WDH05225.1 hypothetical protein PUP57_05970 [Pseudomonas chlororaphis]WDH12020.1 hypothetical protein PUP64_08810 [Pseudomonas chlororaphis]
MLAIASGLKHRAAFIAGKPGSYRTANHSAAGTNSLAKQLDIFIKAFKPKDQ